MEVIGRPHAAASLPTGRESPVSTERRLGGCQSQSGHFGEVKNLLPLFDSNFRSSVSWPSNYSNCAVPAADVCTQIT